LTLADIVSVVIQLIFLEGVLSIDNAAVLGALASRLPRESPVPWPRSLLYLARPTDRFLGRQQAAALKVGLLGAYVGRGAMLFLASLIISNSWIRIVGAAYLLYLAFHYFGQKCESQGRQDIEASSPRSLAGPKLPAHPGFWRTVLAIELADLAFSVDNVVAAVALSPVFWVTLVGVGLGIVLMRFAAVLFARLISWESSLVTGAYLLIAAIGLELILTETAGLRLTEVQQFGISLSILGLTLVFARTPLKKAGRCLAFLKPVCRGFYGLLNRAGRAGQAH
jgi:tellurite resistance protein TerC